MKTLNKIVKAIVNHVKGIYQVFLSVIALIIVGMMILELSGDGTVLVFGLMGIPACFISRKYYEEET